MWSSRAPQALEVADAVAVGVGERADVDLVDDGLLATSAFMRRCATGALALDDGGVGPARRDAVADPLDRARRPP